MSERDEDGATRPARTRAVVLHPHLKSERLDEAALAGKVEEAAGLARAIDLDVVHAEPVALSSWRPSTLVGEGTVERLKGLIAEEHVGLAIVDRALSPIQQRNLEKAWSCKVIDRTGLILEIFGARARTAEGRLQVELARLTYQRGRLVRTWTHLERQRGGRGFLAGPGETQLEADKRIIADKIERLKIQIEDVKRTRGLHRRARSRVPYPVVSLVGYTNAGKSTLFNNLVGAGVFAADMLFATLDPTMRALALPSGQKVILSDTVGFISDIPLDLVAAFRATLEEVVGADLVLHVRDIANPETETQRDDVNRVLRELGLSRLIDDGQVIGCSTRSTSSVRSGATSSSTRQRATPCRSRYLHGPARVWTRSLLRWRPGLPRGGRSATCFCRPRTVRPLRGSTGTERSSAVRTARRGSG
jgi:GTP-binding protein HflX